MAITGRLRRALLSRIGGAWRVRKGRRRPVLDKNLFALPGARRMLGALCLLTLLKAAAIVGQAWALATAVDLLRAGSSVVDAAFALAGFFACFMARQAVVFFQDGMLERYAGDRVAELRSGMLGRVFAEGPLFVGALGTGNAVTLALEGAEQVENYLRLVLPKIAGVVIVPLVLLAFAFPFDWVSGLIMLIVFPFIIFYMVLLGKTAKAEADKQHDEFNRLANHFVDTLRGIDTLKLFGRGAAQGESVFAASERLRIATMKTLRTAILSGAVLDLFATFSVAAVAIMLGFRLVDGSIAFFPALLMLVLVPEYFKPIREYASDYHASLDGKTAYLFHPSCLLRKCLLSFPSELWCRIHRIPLSALFHPQFLQILLSLSDYPPVPVHFLYTLWMIFPHLF